MQNKWISTKDKLPPEGKYVLVRHNRGTWVDEDDQSNVNCVVAKKINGLSLKYRAELDPKSDRARTYGSADEGGNNLVPYYFFTFGPDSFFGQSITHWMDIEPLN
jgi:hypothetical protein